MAQNVICVPDDGLDGLEEGLVGLEGNTIEGGLVLRDEASALCSKNQAL